MIWETRQEGPSIKFYNHLKGTDSQNFHNKAITYREINLEKSPLSKLVLGLCSQTQTDPTEPQDSNTIRSNQTMRKQKGNYLTHWKSFTKKQSKLECYLGLHREYTMAEYLTTVTDPNLRNDLTMYRLSIALLLREASVSRPGSQEKTGYVHTAHKMRWNLSSTS
jgi:hypothetical protein